ncbi:MAG: channel protein hemolysin family [Clostridia bacterium]|nr:channel protein hemolysin family [Clostridia bacterium]
MHKVKKIIVRKNFSMGEEIAHSITHGIGMLLGIVALVLLVIKGISVNHTLYEVSMIIYSVSLIVLYGNSMLYHAFPEGKVKNVFERMDHSSVYLLIAGTYTPFCLLAIGGMGFVLLLAGGVCYSIGVLFFVFNWFKYHHFIWHLFVLAGSILHFFAIYIYV